jgi:hypothetical protein
MLRWGNSGLEGQVSKEKYDAVVAKLEELEAEVKGLRSGALDNNPNFVPKSRYDSMMEQYAASNIE